MVDNAPVLALARDVYSTLEERHAAGRKLFGRPLTLAEKILCAHLDDLTTRAAPPERRKSHCEFRPDRVAMQDATAQMAVLQFMRSGRKQVAAPTTIHCDHLIQARVGADEDLEASLGVNREVYEFLRTAGAKYGMGFWKPGAGIIHQVVLENYAFPGCMMIGTDSHTPNGGGLGMVAIGVGGADAVDVMVGEPFGLLWPGVIGVRLTGELSGWCAPKDVILKLMEILTVKGGTNHIVEFFGPGAATLSATGKGTICNMGAEHGATTSTFPYDASMGRYLRATRRGEIADACDANPHLFRADPEVYATPEDYYDRVIHIDLSTLEPILVGPHTPDLAHTVTDLKTNVPREGYPDDISYALIGSCTNSSYEDMDRAAAVAKSAAAKGLKLKAPLMVTPGSDQIDETIRRDGQMAALESIGATVLANACGPCIGQWKREDEVAGKPNSIVTSYNRNFKKRNDGHAETLAFIGSPELVVAMALGGRLTFDPTRDTITNDAGEEVLLDPPTGVELPAAGFEAGAGGYLPPSADPEAVTVAIDPSSNRIAELEAFPAWDGNDFEDMPILIQALGKCTTDHISQAGPWLRFRGHLDNISDNMLLGAVNRFTGESGRVKNQLDGGSGSPPEVARAYKAANVGWVVVADENYGEGSSREHAAMEPRHLGCKAVVARSMARIAETNLKKQGVLPLTFVDPADYETFREDDRIAILGLADLAPGSVHDMVLTHADGSTDTIRVRHTMAANQIEWFKAGSALNLIASRQNG